MAARGGDPVAPPNGRQGPVAPGVGDMPLSPVGGATSPFFFSRDLVANLKKKKIHFGPVALWGATGGIFEILQNRHIFLKILFF